MKPAIEIGVEKEAVESARRAIKDIINSHAESTVKIAALDTLKTLCSVNNTTITNCTFGGEK